MISLRFIGRGYSRGGSPAVQFSFRLQSSHRIINRWEGYRMSVRSDQGSDPHMHMQDPRLFCLCSTTFHRRSWS